MASVEHDRLRRAQALGERWRDWGPYIAEREWGTPREDYSNDGNAWAYLPHDHARSRAYRWSEDGLAGICDSSQSWCLALAFWNGRDPILKERIFGVSGLEGNHGEDAKELWWYLDSTPTHSWMRWRYIYPQQPFPYNDLINQSRSRNRLEPEYELVDTGVLAEGRYWLVTADFAKVAPHDLCIRLTIINCGPDIATLDVLPTLWFRNTWQWEGRHDACPVIRASGTGLVAEHELAERLVLCGSDDPGLLFCDNETNVSRLFGVDDNPLFPKDGISDHVVSGSATVNSMMQGTKAALRYTLEVAAKSSTEVRLRLAYGAGPLDLGEDFTQVMRVRSEEADAFYAEIAGQDLSSADMAALRAAAANLLWSKQFYHYDVARWKDGDPALPPPPDSRQHGRNSVWRHLKASDVVVVPDPWEYPWPASTELAVCAVGLAWLDPALAKEQLLLLTQPRFAHPAGPLPAYEWNFLNTSPPLHAYAALRVFEIDGGWDMDFLRRMLDALIPNFAWWASTAMVDALGMDYRSSAISGFGFNPAMDVNRIPPPSQYISAGTLAWAGVYFLSLLGLAIRLQESRAEEGVWQIVARLAEYSDELARSLQHDGWWDEDDGFFYGWIDLADGDQKPVRIREIQGFVSLAATLREPGLRGRLLRQAVDDVGAGPVAALSEGTTGEDGHATAGLVSPAQLQRMLNHLGSEDGFLCAFGLRSLSKFHRDEPLELEIHGATARVRYEPGESSTGLFGGNLNSRGPVWPAFNWLLYDGLARLSGGMTGDGDGTAEPISGQADSAIGQRCRSLSSEVRTRLLAVLKQEELGHGIAFPEYIDAESGKGYGAMHSSVSASVFLDLLLRH